MCGNIHGHPRNCIAGPSSWIEMTMLLPPWAIEKSTQCEAANNTAQHRKTQEWQLLAYSLTHQLLSLGKKRPAIAFQGLYFSHFGWKPYTPLVASLHHPRPCFPVVWLAPFTESPPLPLRPTLQYEGEQIGGAFFSTTLKTGCKASSVL